MVKGYTYILSITLFFCMVNFLIIPSQYITLSFLLLLIPGMLMIMLLTQKAMDYKELVAVLACMILLLFSSYAIISTIILWFSYLYISLFYDHCTNVSTTLKVEKLLWNIIVLIFILTVLFVPRGINGDIVVGGGSYDGNYSGVIIFLLFMYAEKRNLKGGKLILLITLIFFSKSRGLLLMTFLFIFIRILKKLNISLPRLNRETAFLVLTITVAVVLIFSYFWVEVISLGQLAEYKTSLNDVSNRMRFSSNIYAWENQLTKTDFNMLFCGFGSDLKKTMGIPNDENVIYNGVRLIQTHNSVLNILVTMGWIPGVVFLWLLVGFICKYFTADNYEYIIPFFINSMLISVYKPNFLIFWCLIIALPCINKKPILRKKLSFTWRYTHIRKGYLCQTTAQKP